VLIKHLSCWHLEYALRAPGWEGLAGGKRPDEVMASLDFYFWLSWDEELVFFRLAGILVIRTRCSKSALGDFQVLGGGSGEGV
jgi:hypothetical protein